MNPVLAAMTQQEQLRLYIVTEALDLAVTIQAAIIAIIFTVGVLALLALVFRIVGWSRASALTMIAAAYLLYYLPNAITPILAWILGGAAFLTFLKEQFFRPTVAVPHDALKAQ